MHLETRYMYGRAIHTNHHHLRIHHYSLTDCTRSHPLCSLLFRPLNSCESAFKFVYISIAALFRLHHD